MAEPTEARMAEPTEARMAEPTEARMAEPTQAPDATSDGGPQVTLRPAVMRCLDIDLAQFEANYWGQRPLLSHTAGFGDLFSAAAVDEVIAVRGLRTPFLRMARGGSVLPAAQYTSGGGAGARIADQADSAKIHSLMTAGATLVLQALHRVWPPLREFAAELTHEIGHPIQINAYVTPPESQGFAAHYDTHDVFVLQVAGTKHWTLHNPVTEHPLPGQEWEKYRGLVADRAAEEPFLATDLSPGDALYLPRGWLHSAATAAGVSIHLTVGVHTLSGRDVTRAALDRVARDPELRRNLPLGAGSSGEALTAMVEPILKEISVAVSALAPTEVAAVLVEGFDQDTPCEPIPILGQLQADPATVAVRWRTGLRPEIHASADRVTVTAGAHRVEAPQHFEPALRLLLDGGVLSSATAPGSADATPLIHRLLVESLVVPVE